ncbi:MAG: four helix bundle protein [Chitinophagaceae bacterium]|nr:MAG: four helix bundle protein [Chitinophagaceae bacterium]
MATIRRFEDIKAWQQARIIAKEIHHLTQKENFRKDFSLIDEIKRSSGSIMDNIAEGYERDGNKEFIQYLSISKGSSGETRSQLYRALDYGYISQEEFDARYEQILHISSLIQNFIQYLKNSGLRGNKFK